MVAHAFASVQVLYLLSVSFETLIGSFVRDHIGIADNFITLSLAAQLRDNLRHHYDQEQLHLAGIGNSTIADHNLAIRGDAIYWLDRAHHSPVENSFLDVIDDFVAYLNATCYAGITGFEFHYARYDTGRFYMRHLDQFKSDTTRKYSLIIYLNADWTIADGGELKVYLPNGARQIAPTNGRGVFFDSSLLSHEVLVTQQPRFSITGWLK